MSNIPTSFYGWAVLEQLVMGAVWDGDLVSKTGRSELVNLGLARRDRKFKSGPQKGCQKNELTELGLNIAIKLL
jgi:hypothetical protein